jgi:hypothetical protein
VNVRCDHDSKLRSRSRSWPLPMHGLCRMSPNRATVLALRAADARFGCRPVRHTAGWGLNTPTLCRLDARR